MRTSIFPSLLNHGQIRACLLEQWLYCCIIVKSFVRRWETEPVLTVNWMDLPPSSFAVLPGTFGILPLLILLWCI